jgi:HAD superfamily hydrolase (TIGR01509 family)
MNKKYSWIFFDLDGTLADSIQAMYQVYIDFLNGFDKRGTKEEFEKLNGPSLSEIVSILKTRYALIDDEVSLADTYRKKISDAYKNIVKPMSGASGVLEVLKNRGYKILLVTSASQEIATEFIKHQRWDKYFENYVFGNEIKKAKPASDIYDLALKKVNASSGSVVIVEDSYNGIKSAKSTGAFVIGLAHNQTKEELAEAGANNTISQLKEILSILEVDVKVMNNLKTNYKIVAIGNIHMRTIQDSSIEKILTQNREAVEEIWQRTLIEKDGKLFNGTLPNFVSVNQERERIEILGHFIEYKQFLAQRKRPDLKLGIKPIGVSGIIVLRDKGDDFVVFAKRTNSITEYPGFLELVPSGSIDKECVDADGVVNYQSKLLSEFIEETGLSKDYVKEISGFAFVLDIVHNVYDICCEILLETKKDLIMQKFSSKEYNAPVFVALGDLDSFIKANVNSIVPTSMAIIEAYRQAKK